MINLTINNLHIEVPEGTTILEAAKMLQIHIPSLCHLNIGKNYVNNCASCRVCVVEVAGRSNLIPACSTVVTEDMVVRTSTPRAITTRKIILELLLSDHPSDCLLCAKNTRCELQKLAFEMGIREIPYVGEKSEYPIDSSSASIVRDPNKCIMCRRCETVCNNIQTVGVYSAVDRGFKAVVSTAFNEPMTDTACTFCGQCVSVCPTAALTEQNASSQVMRALNDPDKYVVVQTAPAIRVALGEEFGLEPGTIVTGQMVAALRQMGFKKVIDTDFAADLTIMEEASELINRIQNNGRLPLLTSCCPAWVNFFEHHFPDLLDIPSTCKSPHEMMGAIIKTYLAKKLKVNPKKIFVVSIMPCLAKKYESSRPELSNDGLSNVDAVLSTRELAAMIKEAGVSFNELPPEEFDHPLGESTGASVIFGTSGGVIEAAVRTAYEWITEEPLEAIEFEQLRGMEGIREATVHVGDLDLKIGIASGLGNARKLLEAIRDGKAEYHAIEIMACPSGCINGGGQPPHHNDWSVIEKRKAALYADDRNKELRLSHHNPEIQKLYDDFLGTPNSHLAHSLLHTSYKERHGI